MTLTRARSCLVAVASAALVIVGSAAAAAPASDSPHVAGDRGGGVRSLAGPLGDGTPGYCPTKKGVTVVVDFNQLGGGIVVRCAPGPIGSGYTGLDALQDAGFSPAGTTRWGLQFICRIAGKPAADQKVPIKGDPNYKEKCVDTPPASAFWSYWYAPNEGSWTLSNEGPVNRDVIPGGFEGWSFSLNHTQDTAPAPGIAPQRPQKPPHSSPTSPPTSPPHSSPPPTHPTHGGGGGGGSQPTTPSAPPSTSPVTTAPTHTRSSPSQSGQHHSASAYGSTLNIEPGESSPSSSTDPLAVGHNAKGEKVSGELPDSATSASDGSPRAAVFGILLLAILAGGGYVAWRRRQTGNG